GTSQNTVLGNYIGLNAAGTAAVPNASFQQGRSGIWILNGATGNTIGGLNSGDANVISGNASNGVHIQDPATTNNLVIGNHIGTNPAGTSAIANTLDGILIDQGANNNTIGGNVAGAGNVISGNALFGLEIAGGGTNSNWVAGNYIGTNAAGTAVIGNAGG